MLTLIIKPTHRCNLNCTYCYDRPNREKDKSKMDFDTVENIFKIASTKTNKINVIWHGGEPMLLGVNWYKKIYEEIIPKYYSLDNVNSSFQTNGTLFDPYFLAFVEKYNISLGMSYDGITNNSTRGNTEKLKENRKKAKLCDFKNGWDNFLMVVTPSNASTIIESYKESMKEHFSLDFSEVFSEQSSEDAEKEIKIILDYYKEFFKYFLTNVRKREIPRPFRFYVNHVINIRVEGICENIECVGNWLGIHPDGTIFPCGRDWKDDYTYGNINHLNHFDDIYKTNGYQLMKKGEETLKKNCSLCDLNKVCNGGCPNTRLLTTGAVNRVNYSQCFFAKQMVNLVEEVLLELKAYEIVNEDMLKRIIKTNYESYKDIKQEIKRRREHVRYN